MAARVACRCRPLPSTRPWCGSCIVADPVLCRDFDYLAGGMHLCRLYSGLSEFFSVVTNPRRVEHPLTLDEALQKLTVYQLIFPVITPLSGTFNRMIHLLNRYPVFRERVFDIYLTATALDNNIRHICTWNTKDFKSISEIKKTKIFLNNS